MELNTWRDILHFCNGLFVIHWNLLLVGRGYVTMRSFSSFFDPLLPLASLVNLFVI